MSTSEVTIETTKYIQEYEGMTVEEAALSYKAREKLPTGAFCGPDKSYPAHDAKRVQAGLQRLSQFWAKMAPSTRSSIFRCLQRRAKKHGIEISEDVLKKMRGKSVEEIDESQDALIEWYINLRKEK